MDEHGPCMSIYVNNCPKVPITTTDNPFGYKQRIQVCIYTIPKSYMCSMNGFSQMFKIVFDKFDPILVKKKNNCLMANSDSNFRYCIYIYNIYIYVYIYVYIIVQYVYIYICIYTLDLDTNTHLYSVDAQIMLRLIFWVQSPGLLCHFFSLPARVWRC